jgi:hypothetical protein
MKDLLEAVREYDERDRERVAPFNCGFGRTPTESERLVILEGRFLDAMQLISWIVGHIIELEKGDKPH